MCGRHSARIASASARLRAARTMKRPWFSVSSIRSTTSGRSWRTRARRASVSRHLAAPVTAPPLVVSTSILRFDEFQLGTSTARRPVGRCQERFRQHEPRSDARPMPPMAASTNGRFEVASARGRPARGPARCGCSPGPGPAIGWRAHASIERRRHGVHDRHDHHQRPECGPDPQPPPMIAEEARRDAGEQ